MDLVDRPNVDVEPGFPSLVQKWPGGEFLVDMDRGSVKFLCGHERIFFDADTTNHPDARFRRQLSDASQAVIVERRKNRLIQIIIMAKNEQKFDLHPWP